MSHMTNVALRSSFSRSIPHLQGCDVIVVKLKQKPDKRTLRMVKRIKRIAEHNGIRTDVRRIYKKESGK